MKNGVQNVCLLLLFLLENVCFGLDRRPTISFITQPEIVTDIGGTIEMDCSVQYAQDYPVIWMKLDQVNLLERLASLEIFDKMNEATKKYLELFFCSS